MAQRLNLTIDQGATFSYSFTVLGSNLPSSLSDYTGTASMKRSHLSTSTTGTFTVNVVGLVVTLSMTAAQTATLLSGRHVYDVLLTKGSSAIRAAQGLVTVSPSV